MKKVFSSLLLVLIWPFRFLKKSKIDNFVGGLIFGAVFSLVVNILTVQIQEVINKQRTLEAIENEIVINVMQANNIIKSYDDSLKNASPINYFYYSPPYSVDFWTQSGDALRYIAQLDHGVQVRVTLLYDIIFKNANGQVSRTNDIINKDLSKCFDSNFVYKIDDDFCSKLNSTIRTSENLAAELVSQHGNETLDYFHPTEDRLNSWLLKLLLGSKSLIILSGK